MDPQETIECLKILLDSVVLDKGNPMFTILNEIKPSSFKFVLQEAITLLENIDD